MWLVSYRKQQCFRSTLFGSLESADAWSQLLVRNRCWSGDVIGHCCGRMQVDRAALWGLCDYAGETTRDKLPIVPNSHFWHNDYTLQSWFENSP